MNQSERIHPQADKLELLPQCARGTAMGTLLRMFWQPVARSSALAIGHARSVRILGEDLTLYRGESGRPYLVGGRCAHRLSALHTGWIEGERIRCMYHGWQFDGTGRCTSARRKAIPARPTSGSPAIRCTNMPAPSSPTWAKARRRNSSCCARTCSNARTACCSRARRSGPATGSSSSRTRSMPPMSASSITGAGRKVRPARRRHPQARICRDRRRHPSDRDALEEQRAGERLDLPQQEPHRGAGARRAILDRRRALERPARRHPHPAFRHLFGAVGWRGSGRKDQELFRGVRRLQSGRPPRRASGREEGAAGRSIQLTSAQDYVAAIGQGASVDRSRELLGKSDAGIALLRRIFWRELDAIRAGRPTKAWRRLEQSSELPRQVAEPTGA